MMCHTWPNWDRKLSADTALPFFVICYFCRFQSWRTVQLPMEAESEGERKRTNENEREQENERAENRQALESVSKQKKK